MMSSPEPVRQLYPQHPFERRGYSSSLAMVSPCSTRTSIQQWMSRRMRGRKAQNHCDNSSLGGCFISEGDRAEVSRAVLGILRDNLPPSLEAQTSPEELADVADAIERKLCQTAPSPHAYRSFSTLEFRITALATAVLIHSDRDGDRRGVSDTCARLSAAAQRSLVYCIMVLFSYEKRNLDRRAALRRRMEHDNDFGLSQQQQHPDGNGNTNHSRRITEHGMYSKRVAACMKEFIKSQRANSLEGGGNSCLDSRVPNVPVVVEDSNQVYTFPPSA